MIILDTTRPLRISVNYKTGGKRDGINFLASLAVELDGLRFEVCLKPDGNRAFKFDRVRLAKTRVINTPFTLA